MMKLLEIQRFILRYYNLIDFYSLCINVGVKYGELSGKEFDEKVHNMVAYLVQSGQLKFLIWRLRYDHPEILQDERGGFPKKIEIICKLNTAYLEGSHLKANRLVYIAHKIGEINKVRELASEIGEEICGQLMSFVPDKNLDVIIEVDSTEEVRINPSSAWAIYYARPKNLQMPWRIDRNVNQLPKINFVKSDRTDGFEEESQYLEIRHDGFRPAFISLNKERVGMWHLTLQPVLNKRVAIADFETSNVVIYDGSESIVKEIAYQIEAQPFLGNQSYIDDFRKAIYAPFKRNLIDDIGNEVLHIKDMEEVENQMKIYDIAEISGQARYLKRRALDIQFLVQGRYELISESIPGENINAEQLDFLSEFQFDEPNATDELLTIGSSYSILFLAADPTDLSRLRLGEELREIQEKLQLAKLRERFELHQRMSVRPSDISQALLDIHPRIVHFSGHGTSAGALCFENQTGVSHPVQPDALAALFEQFDQQVYCVVLNACYSEPQAKAIAAHIKYVIGMNQAIGDKAAIAFITGFYQALGAGRTVEEAYKLGCVQIKLWNIPEDLTPVLIKK